MRIPQNPPKLDEMWRRFSDAEFFRRIAQFRPPESASCDYAHWDKLRRHPAPEGFTHEEWWFATKFSRLGALRPIPLHDKVGDLFQFGLPSLVQEELHRIDTGAGSTFAMPERITSRERDQYIVRSLMEEAITSSQLEGAATTREVAKEMIRKGREPRDTDERMILNNFLTMNRIRELRSEPLAPELVFEIHRRVTDQTLENFGAAGRFRNDSEQVCVTDPHDVVYHMPPAAGELPNRLAAMCDFANGKTPDFFVHPVIRAIILHFWLAYDHPFVDGNGRTARALFYWSMLRADYWLFEFISISNILRKAPGKYLRSFLYVETDDNDLTYFIVAQTRVIRQAISELHAYFDKKSEENRQAEKQIRALALHLFNHRQVELLRHALKHKSAHYTIRGHELSHRVTYQTARADLLDLVKRGIFEQQTRGRQHFFSVPSDLEDRLRQISPESKKD